MYQNTYKKYQWRFTDKDIEDYEAYRKRNEPSLLASEPATGLPSRKQRECIALIKTLFRNISLLDTAMPYGKTGARRACS